MTTHTDPDQVAEICRLAIAAIPHASRATVQALHCTDGIGGGSVNVVLVSARGRRSAEQALRRHGYRVAAVSNGNTLCVTGLDPEALAKRVTALCRAVSGLERGLPHTIATAAHTYVRLHRHIEPAIALYGTADALRADIEAGLERRVGPLTRRHAAPRDLAGIERERLAAVNELTRRTIDLLAQHWHAAIRTCERVAELSHRLPLPDVEARAVAETRSDVARRRRRAVFLDAHRWADHHLAGTDVPAFAAWYAAEHGPPRWPVAPLADAARRWAALEHPRPDAHHGSPSGDLCRTRISGGSR